MASFTARISTLDGIWISTSANTAGAATIVLMDALVTFLSLATRTCWKLSGNTLGVDETRTLRTRGSFDEHAFLAVELTSSGTGWVTQDALALVVASFIALGKGSLDAHSIDILVEIRASRVLDSMDTVSILVLGVLRAFAGLSDFPIGLLVAFW